MISDRCRAAAERLQGNPTDQLTHPDRTVQISPDTVVMLTYKLYTGAGELIEEAREPITYLHGGQHVIFPKIGNQLSEQQAGQSLPGNLPPDDAVGGGESRLGRAERPYRFPT